MQAIIADADADPVDEEEKVFKKAFFSSASSSPVGAKASLI